MRSRAISSTTSRAAVDAQVFQAEAPLVGNQLASRDVGEFFSELDDRLDGFQPSSPTAEATKVALEQSLVGLLDGEIQVVQTESHVEFSVPVRSTRTDSLALDLGLGDRSMVDVLLNNDDAVDVTLEWTYVLTFGVMEQRGVSSFYVNPSQMAEVQIHSTLKPEFAGGLGRMGVFVSKFSAGEASAFSGAYQIGIQDANSDGIISGSEIDNPAVSGRLSGTGEVHLNASGEFIPDVANTNSDAVFNLAVSTDVVVSYDMQQIDTDVIDASGRQTTLLDVDATVAYENVELDLGTLFTDFINPTIGGIQKTLQPLKPVVDGLTDPLPVVSDIAGEPINALFLAENSCTGEWRSATASGHRKDRRDH